MWTKLEALLHEGPRPSRTVAEVELSGKRGDAWRDAARHFSCREKREQALAKLRALGVSVAENSEDTFPRTGVRRG